MEKEEFKSFSDVIEDDIYEAIDMKTCVERRNTTGAPGIGAMEQVIKANKEYLDKYIV